MTAIIRDLWPADIRAEEIIAPEEILRFQAESLTARTNGLLVGHIAKLVGDDRAVLGFEVEAPRAGNRVRLFEVQHRRDFEYPVAIIPPADRLPDFLREHVYRPGLSEAAAAAASFSTEGQWVKNEWVATTPGEFTNKVEELLALPSVKGIVLSLLSRSRAGAQGNGNGNERPA
jgi:hypothetical protein